MKTIFAFLFYFFSIISLFAQENSFSYKIKIQEPSKKIHKIDEINKIDFWEYSNPEDAGKYKLPSKTIFFAIPQNSNPKISIISQKITNLENSIPEIQPTIIKKNDSTLVYKEISNVQFPNIDLPEFTLEPQFWFREFNILPIKLYTHKFNLAKYSIEQVEEYQIKIEFNGEDKVSNNSPIIINTKFDEIINNMVVNGEIAEQFRESNKKYKAKNYEKQKWFNDGQEFLKFSIIQDGIYRLDRQFFEANSIDLSQIDSRTFQLYNKGIEIPLFLSTDNNVFSETDYIQFYGNKNYSEISNRIINNADKEYNNYLDIYSDTSYYFLTWNFQDGNRLNLQTDFSDTIIDTIDYYTHFEHFETNSWFQNCYNDEVENQQPTWNRNKTWYWGWFGSWGPTKNINFTISDLYPNKSANFYSKLVSSGSNISQNSHQIKFSVNDIKIDSQNVNRFNQVLLKGSINSNFLTNGTNKLTIYLYNNETNPNYLAFDWYEIEYPRLLQLQNDSISFTITDNLNNIPYIFKITNATSQNYEIFKISNQSKKITNYQIQENSLLFTDTLSFGDKYSIISEEKQLTPKFVISGRFKNLLDSYQTDYLAITSNNFFTSVKEYLEIIEEKYNVSTNCFVVEDIFNNYGFGYQTPQSIQDFIIDVYNTFPSPKLTYLVLFGDATYDYKYFIKNNIGTTLSYNIIPSFGNPVGDYRYGIWEENSVIPNLIVGRVPFTNQNELLNYQSKLINNEEAFYNSWNKKYLFFSGGSSDDISEINSFKNVNQNVISQYVDVEPLYGSFNHFYKTQDPQTDFGPFPPELIQTAISEGSVFVSYIGHSGTSTWDNSINSIQQLTNSVNRNPLITDFGCSTNKFAEPDIICFGEHFIINNDGQALGYIGNSSLGFSSTATTAPNYFYENIISDSIHEVGKAHLQTKIDILSNLGTNNVNKLFAQTNILLGDPIIQLKIPSSPNLTFENESVLEHYDFNDNMENQFFNIQINNYGIVNGTTIDVRIQESYNSEVISDSIYSFNFPKNQDTLSIPISTYKKPGKHTFNFIIDPNNIIEEFDEDDNITAYETNIYSMDIRNLLSYSRENGNLNSIILLNTTTNSEIKNVELQVSTDSNFSITNNYNLILDSIYIKYLLNSDINNRYWFRLKLPNSNDYSSTFSFFNDRNSIKYLINDKFSFYPQRKVNIGNTDTLIISNQINTISVLSAGTYAGATCVITKNAINLLPNSYFTGMGIVVFDSLSLEVDTSASFSLFDNIPNAQALATLINSIPTGKIVVMGVSDDGQHRLISELKNAIKTIGSTKIDTLKFQGSWAIIGRKGASPGDCIEIMKRPYDGQVFLDTTITFLSDSGSLITSQIGKATKWKSLNVQQRLVSNSQITYIPLGIRENGEIDTLQQFIVQDSTADLSFIDAKIYPQIKLLAQFSASSNKISPELYSLGVDYVGIPELAINYQVVSVEQDSVEQGENETLNFSIYNAGDSKADNFYINVKLKDYENNSTVILTQFVDSISAENKRNFSVIQATANLNGSYLFEISIDDSNKVVEYFEDNNYFTIPFYVKADTTKPSIDLLIDQKDILNGEFISPTPEIILSISDESILPITDTSSAIIKLNGQSIYSNNPDIEIAINQSNPKYVVTFTPTLQDGDYTLFVNGKDANGNIAMENGITKSFKISSQLLLMDVYNYPNPFANETYFTFKLPQIPDEMEIKIFTVAGRLIKSIKANSSELEYDFNKLFWDGKDEDGDEIANGTYFYKIIMKKADETITSTGKLVKMK